MKPLIFILIPIQIFALTIPAKTPALFIVRIVVFSALDILLITFYTVKSYLDKKAKTKHQELMQRFRTQG